MAIKSILLIQVGEKKKDVVLSKEKKNQRYIQS